MSHAMRRVVRYGSANMVYNLLGSAELLWVGRGVTYFFAHTDSREQEQGCIHRSNCGRT